MSPGLALKPVLSGVPRVDSDFVGSKAYAMLEALLEKNSIKSQI